MVHRLFAVHALLLGLALAGAGRAGAQEQQAAEPRAWITPAQGATLTVIRIFAKDLPGLTDVAILAGPAPDRLYPISASETDAEGDLGIQLKVPEEAERGEPFYFAVDPVGEAGPVLAQPPFEVLVRVDPAPGGA